MGRPEENGWQETPFGPVPAEWGVKPLSKCAVVQTGVAKGRRLNAAEAVTVPYLRVANVQDGYLDLSEIKEIEIRRSELDRYSLLPGDVVLTEGGDFDKLGRGFIWNGEMPGCVHQNHIFAVRPQKDALLPEFLAYLTQSPYGKAYFLSVAHKTTNLACINTTKLKAFPTLLPSLGEQRAIAYILRTVQRAKEATEKVIAAARQLKQSLLRHLFTYGPVPVEQADQVPLKETEFGQVPEHWRVATLGELASLSTGSTPSTKRPEYYRGPVPFIKTAQITNNRIHWADTFVSEEAVQECNLKVFQPGTVFLAMYGQGKTRGQVGLLEIEAATTQNTAAIVSKGQVSGEFLWQYLQTQYERLRSSGMHGQISHLNLSCVRDFQVVLPPAKEQTAIIHAARSIDMKIGSESDRFNALDKLFRSLLHHLMTGKVRVNELAFPATKEGSP